MPNTPGFDTAAMAAAITAAQESGGPIVDTASSPDNGVPPGFDTTALVSGDPNGTVQIAGEGAGGVALSAPPPATRPSAAAGARPVRRARPRGPGTPPAGPADGQPRTRG